MLKNSGIKFQKNARKKLKMAGKIRGNKLKNWDEKFPIKF